MQRSILNRMQINYVYGNAWKRKCEVSCFVKQKNCVNSVSGEYYAPLYMSMALSVTLQIFFSSLLYKTIPPYSRG